MSIIHNRKLSSHQEEWSYAICSEMYATEIIIGEQRNLMRDLKGTNVELLQRGNKAECRPYHIVLWNVCMEFRIKHNECTEWNTYISIWKWI